MGMGATNTLDRKLASIGAAGPVEITFCPTMDTVNAGVLLSLPALLAVGLFTHEEAGFTLPLGYYRMSSIFLLLSFMALSRVKSVESLRYSAPGEWGKLLGLDRVPEVRTLRKKIALLAVERKPMVWSAQLSKDWMKNAPEQCGALYVDGHVRVYHGKLAHLPRRYVAREKLCLRGTVDYWINAMNGEPFFFVHKDVSSGLINALNNDIIPRLLEDVPNQPAPETLDANPLLHRFTIVFDREGYSPELLLQLKKKRIACLTYHKFPQGDWRPEEFHNYSVRLPSAQEVEMNLAERGTLLGKDLWLREVRRLTKSGHQTSIISTDFESDLTRLAVRMFARWSQENFFKYARENFSLDRLVEYGVEEIPEAENVQVVNPEYRRLDQEVRKEQGLLNKKLAELGALRMPPLNEDKKVIEAYAEKKAALDEAVVILQERTSRLKVDRKQIARHISLAELPEKERFNRCIPQAKHLLDTIKMVAYRAETAMANTLREVMSRDEDARNLLRAIYSTEADLLPNEKEKTLTVRIHHLANRCSDRAVQHLCKELTDTKTIFPDTDLRMIYEFVS